MKLSLVSHRNQWLRYQFRWEPDPPNTPSEVVSGSLVLPLKAAERRSFLCLEIPWRLLAERLQEGNVSGNGGVRVDRQLFVRRLCHRSTPGNAWRSSQASS